MVFHVGFTHITSNLITQLLFGSWLEGMVGFKHTAAAYIASGLGGNIFSSYVNFKKAGGNGSSVGASTAINGVLTA